MFNGEPLTWKCHICGRERPDDKISVWKSPLVLNGQQVGTQNVRYCNDNTECFEKAQHYSFIKEGQHD